MLPLLNVYSQYSFMQALATPAELARAAADRGCRELALADVNSLHGLVEFVREADEAGIRPLAGSRVDVAGGGRVILLSRRDGSLAPLVRAVNSAALDRYAPEAYLEGLLVLAGDESMPLRLLARGDEIGASRMLDRWQQVVGRGNVWLAATPDNRRLWPRLEKAAAKLGLGVAACPPVRWVKPEQRLAYQAYRALNAGLPDHRALLPDAAQLEGEYRVLSRALAGARELAERAGAPVLRGRVYLPRFGEDDNEKLYRLCQAGLERRYRKDDGAARQRLERELAVIEEMGFASYFLIAWDLVRFARQQGIAVGPGRGSAAGSMVSYLLDITRVDPLAHNLLFERFLNPHRVSLPDIDIDFCYRRRDEVFAYAVERYGRDRTCQVGTYNTYGPRGSLRDAGRALGFSRQEIDSLCRQVPGRGQLATIIAGNSHLAALAKRPPWQRWFALAAQLEGRVRHTSVHAGALLITPFPLDQLVPVERAAGGDICSQWDKDGVEAMGLLKMDLLAVRGLTLNQQVAAAVGRKEVARRFSYNDPAALNLLRRGQTLGCLQLESEGMRSLMRQLKPRGLEDVIALLSLYRPGPWQAGMVERYIARRHGRERVECYHPDLEPVLRDTYGVLLYQEQVMEIAQIIGGYSPGEADLLRRAIAKLRRGDMERLTREFCTRAEKRGYAAELAQRLLQAMVEFSGYAFNRAHSAAYGHLAMAAVFLKAHWPYRFCAAVIANHMGYYPAQVYVNEAVRLGGRVLPPCVNHSGVETEAAGNIIRLGLDRVKSLGAGVAKIVAARPPGGYRDLDDFVRRTGLAAGPFEQLIHAGALDCLEPNRRQLLAALPLLAVAAGGDLLADAYPRLELPMLPDLGLEQKIANQYASLGLLLHPRWLARQQPPWDAPRVDTRQLARLSSGKEVVVAAAVVNRRNGYITLDDFSGQAEARCAAPIPARWVWARGKADGRGQLEQVELNPLL